MTRAYILIAVFLGGAAPAVAHPGHLADTGTGHAHWFALVAALGAAVIAACALVRWRERHRTSAPEAGA